MLVLRVFIIDVQKHVMRCSGCSVELTTIIPLVSPYIIIIDPDDQSSERRRGQKDMKKNSETGDWEMMLK